MVGLFLVKPNCLPQSWVGWWLGKISILLFATISSTLARGEVVGTGRQLSIVDEGLPVLRKGFFFHEGRALARAEHSGEQCREDGSEALRHVEGKCRGETEDVRCLIFP